MNIWKPTAEMKMIVNDFATLKLDEENKITIGGKSASEFIYSGHGKFLEVLILGIYSLCKQIIIFIQ